MIPHPATIFAPATAPGRSGVAVVRVSGPGAFDSARILSGGKDLPPRHAVYATLRDPATAKMIDRALVIAFPGPASFTGENVVEYHLHGGPAIMRMMLDALSRCAGHRMAEPGEFTRRAFDNGKIDLTGAEAIADLIDAETELQQQQAMAQMGGALSALYDGWADQLARALAHIEADIDFPDEDMPDGIAAQSMPVLRKIYDAITDHLDDGGRGERMRDGFQVVVIGAPNAGKSSLVNALVRRDVAIVSEHAGTTRDVLEAHLDLKGYPVVLVDTAGLRPDQLGADAQSAIEGEGIRRAVERARYADVKVLLFDATLGREDEHTAALRDDRALCVYTKADLLSSPDKFDGVLISTRNGTGMDDLIAAIVARLETLYAPRGVSGPTRRRHRAALEECRFALDRALHAPLGATAPELMAEDVRMAVRALGRITGRVDVEDLLDIIFRDFCIGK